MEINVLPTAVVKPSPHTAGQQSVCPCLPSTPDQRSTFWDLRMQRPRINVSRLWASWSLHYTRTVWRCPVSYVLGQPSIPSPSVSFSQLSLSLFLFPLSFYLSIFLSLSPDLKRGSHWTPPPSPDAAFSAVISCHRFIDCDILNSRSISL